MSLKPPSSVALMAQDFGLPALRVGVVAVHFVQVAGEQGRLVAAGAGADFHDHARAVGVLAADRQLQQLAPQRLALVAQLRQLGLGQLAHLGVVAVDHLLRFGDLAGDLLELAILLGQLAERAMLAGDGRDARRIRQHLGIDEVLFELLEAGQFLFE